MRRLVLPVLFIAFSALSAAPDNWYTGYIILKNKNSLRGEVAIQYEYDVVLFRLGSDITVFPAHKVESFGLYDTEINGQKEFVSIEFNDGVVTSHHFFERIVAGDYDVLRRQQSTWYSLHLEIEDYDYYVRTDDGSLFPLEKFRRKIYPSLVEKTDGALAVYAKKNALSPGRTLDAVLIVRHYNQMQADSRSLAKN